MAQKDSPYELRVVTKHPDGSVVEEYFPMAFFTVKDLTHVMRMGHTKIRNLLSRGVLEHCRIDGQLLVSQEQLIAFVRKMETDSGFVHLDRA